MKLFALSITILLARAGAEIGPHLLDGTETPTLHRDISRHQLSIEDLLTPFAGKKTGLAFCEAEYGQSLVAIDLDDYCYCQTDCQCLDDVEEDPTYLVATRRSITELPQEC